MIDKTSIVPIDLNPKELCDSIIGTICRNVLIYSPGHAFSTDELRKTTLIIMVEPDSSAQSLFDNPALPSSTPILYLGTSDTVPPLVAANKDRKLIDYIKLPVSLDIILHNVAFLTQIQKVSYEHHITTTTFGRQLDVLSSRDGLTGLFNRRQLTSNLIHALQKANLNGEDLILLLLNIDFFNKVNKFSGQKFGDYILNEMAARLTLVVPRETDTCYRFSGEEFVVLMPNTTLNDACEKAEKIRVACTEKPYIFNDKSRSITVSAGIASLHAHQPETHDEFISMAETALYLAKAHGRDRIQVFDSEVVAGDVTPHKSLEFLKDTLYHIMEHTRNSAISSLQLLARKVAGPDHLEHSSTVSRYFTLLGQHLGLPEPHIQTFQNAISLFNSFRSLLHNDLVTKPGELSQIERRVINDLPFKITELTDIFDFFSDERNVLLCHGERYDGTGHPRGLKGDEIPLGARIFSIIDALAAMDADRPYRKRLTPDEIIMELQKEAGKHFDPYLVTQVLTVIEKNHLLNLDDKTLHLARHELFTTFPELKP